MSYGVQIPPTVPDPTEFAVRAEELGYEAAWVPELWYDSGTVRLADIAARTDDIELGSAILNVFSRTPAVLAMTAATLDRISGGRFTLGVGTSTPKAVEDLHGMRFENPVRRAHECIELTKEFLGDEGRVEYDGELFQVADFPSLGREVDVYHAALGPANRRVVARLCEGWIPHNVPWSELPDAYDYVREHAAEAGRDGEAITVAPYVPAAVCETEAEARQLIREHVAYYAGNGTGYEKAVGSRYPEAAEAIASAWREGDRSRAAELVTDEMVADLGVAGTAETAPDRLAEVVGLEVIDRPMLVVPQTAGAETAERTLEALAPA
jgi:alkanesulfonate monooxygenase SsuD/methylene tetrahydromethanopterin reductase-like flavin-dependent oxidoreductase (luciferase family)